MNDRTRIVLAPGWLLHRYPYRETSLIAEVLTREHGRIGLVARGARAPRRTASTVLAPFTPLLLSFRQGGELANLDKVEAAGQGHTFRGDRFLAACYVNELLLRLLPRGDAMPEVYALYEDTLLRLEDHTAQAVRRFEGRLMRLLGVLPSLTRDVDGLPLKSERCYRYDHERGLVPAEQGETGALLLAIADERYDDERALKVAAGLFRGIITAHLHGRPLRSLDVARAMTTRGVGVAS
ncbi:MAG: DNA repair protein RecO [Gammaproteobacteria bacterium]